MSNQPTKQQKVQLIRFQQAELDAVVIYQKLAMTVQNPNHQQLFKKMAADEGKHAAILRKYTGEVLKPSARKAYLVFILYKVLGINTLFSVLEKGERKAAVKYTSFVTDFPLIAEIISDENKHADLIAAMK